MEHDPWHARREADLRKIPTLTATGRVISLFDAVPIGTSAIDQARSNGAGQKSRARPNHDR